MRIPRLHLKTLLFVSLAVLPFAAAARAATPSGDVYFGYSRLGSDAFNDGTGGLNGWQLAGYIKARPLLGGEVDVAHYGFGASSDVPHSTSVLLGPRATVHVGPLGLFAHALVGGEHSSDSAGFSDGALAWAFGGGVDLSVAPRIAWRIGADYIDAPTQSPADATRARFTTGIVVRW